MTPQQMTEAAERFWRATWTAWRSEALAEWLPGPAKAAAVPFEDFLASSDDVRHAAIETFLRRFAPGPGEFLVGFDGMSAGSPSFVLTSNRIVVRDKRNDTYAALDLAAIESFEDKGWWSKTYTISTPDRAHVFVGLDAVPMDEIMRLAIGQAREDPPWSTILEGPPGAAAAQHQPGLVEALAPRGEEDEEPEVDVGSLKETKDWFAFAETSTGERRVFDKEQLVATLRGDILSGALNATSTIEIHFKTQDGSWSTTTSPLAQFAKNHFKLRLLYEPVWSHATAGLKWGALIGIGLKLLDTLILLGSADPALAVMFLVVVAVVAIPRVGIAAVILVAIVMSRYTEANFFIMGLSAALIGATLGCLPGMAIGGIVGLRRRTALELAPDATPESGVLLKAVVLPVLGAATLWLLYLLVFNPWIVSVLE